MSVGGERREVMDAERRRQEGRVTGPRDLQTVKCKGNGKVK